MKIEIDPRTFAEAVAWTAPSLARRPSVPVLAGIRLAAEGPELTVSAFDYDTSAQCRVPVKTEADGEALVSGRLLAEIVKSLPSKPVTLETDGSRAALACGTASFSLLTMPVEDYPSLPAMPDPAGTLGSDLWASAVAQATVAAGKDDTLPALTGVRVEIDGDTLTLIATDRYRLAVRTLAWTPGRPGLKASLLVPAATLANTARALTSGAEVSIALALPGEEGAGGEGMIGFEGAGRQTTTRLLGGDFPRYEALLPKAVSGTAELAAGPFAEAVKRVALVAERNTAVRLSFTEGQLVLEAGTGDEAQAVEVLEAGYDGPEMKIAFNPAYLLDGLTAIGSETARIAFTEPGKPALITGKPSDPDGVPDYRYLLMPIRLGG
jgi:DNA polymerase III subunit beta